MRYVKPEMEIQEFRMTDIIMTSGGDGVTGDGVHEENDGDGVDF